MIKIILVPLDGSEVAEQGLAAACRLAKETGSTLLLVRAVLYYAVEADVRAEETHDLREAQAYLEKARGDLERQGMSAATEVLPGDPVRAILFAAKAHEVDLISICTHGRPGVRHALVGSVAEAVLRGTQTPILLTRSGARDAPPNVAPYGRILVPLDGTAFAETALSYLIDQGIGQSASLILLRVVSPASTPFMPDPTGYGAAEVVELAERHSQEGRQEAEAYLRALGDARLADGMWHPRPLIGDAGDAILEVASHEQVDLIALATHGRHGWDRLLHGSVTRHLLHRAPAPLLILRGVALDPAGAHVPATTGQCSAGPTGAGHADPSAQSRRPQEQRASRRAVASIGTRPASHGKDISGATPVRCSPDG